MYTGNRAPRGKVSLNHDSIFGTPTFLMWAGDGKPVDLVNGLPITESGTTHDKTSLDVQAVGMAGGTETLTLPAGHLIATGAPNTIATIIYLDAQADSFPGLFVLTAAGIQEFECFYGNATYDDWSTGGSSSWANVKYAHPASVPKNGILLFLVFVYNGAGFGTAGNFTAYVNGISMAQTASAAFGGQAATNSLMHLPSTASSRLDGRMLMFGIFPEAWSAAKAEAFYAAETRWDYIHQPKVGFRPVVVVGGTTPKGPLGHPFYGPLAGPIAA